MDESNYEEENYHLINGPPSRVFRNELPEFTPDLKLYSTNEYPLRDLAKDGGLEFYYALPVFEPSSLCCVGVLELLRGNCSSVIFLDDVMRVLKTSNLTSFNQEEYLEKIVSCSGIHVSNMQRAKDEIKLLLELVCEKNRIRFSQTWITYRPNGCTVNYGDSMEESSNSFDKIRCTKEMVAQKVLESRHDHSWYAFRKACDTIPLRGGQGIVGKAIRNHKSFFCQDISRCNIIEYPLAHFARQDELHSCLAICIRSSYTGNFDYVLELFLPQKICIGEARALLSSILATMKLQFKSLELASSEELGEDLSDQESKVEAAERSTNTIYTSFITISTDSESESTADSAVHNLKDMNIHACNDINVAHHHDVGACGIFKQLPSSAFTLKTISSNTKDSECESESTCRKPDFFGGSSCNRENDVFSLSNSKEANKFGQVVVTHVTQSTVPVQDVKVEIKASFNQEFIKFWLSCSSGMADLVENVTMRLKALKEKTFKIIYKDTSGVEFLIACDKDLQYCISRS